MVYVYITANIFLVLVCFALFGVFKSKPFVFFLRSLFKLNIMMV